MHWITEKKNTHTIINKNTTNATSQSKYSISFCYEPNLFTRTRWEKKQNNNNAVKDATEIYTKLSLLHRNVFLVRSLINDKQTTRRDTIPMKLNSNVKSEYICIEYLLCSTQHDTLQTKKKQKKYHHLMHAQTTTKLTAIPLYTCWMETGIQLSKEVSFVSIEHTQWETSQWTKCNFFMPKPKQLFSRNQWLVLKWQLASMH